MFGERMKMGDVVAAQLQCKHGTPTDTKCDQCKAEIEMAPPHQDQGETKHGE